MEMYKKSVQHVQSCCFDLLNLFLFLRLRCRRRLWMKTWLQNKLCTIESTKRREIRLELKRGNCVRVQREMAKFIGLQRFSKFQPSKKWIKTVNPKLF